MKIVGELVGKFIGAIIGSYGIVWAVLLSFGRFHSMGWAMWASAWGWFYVLYFWLHYGLPK